MSLAVARIESKGTTGSSLYNGPNQGLSHGGFEFPDIEARFDVQKYVVRQTMLAEYGLNNVELPHGYPEHVESPGGVWGPGTLALEEIVHQVSTDNLEELDAALTGFKEGKLDLNDISPRTFQLPTLGPRLRNLSWDIHNGKAAAIIRGLKPDRHSLKDNIIIFAGVASYIGDQRGRQSSQNDVLTHLYSIRDKSILDPRPGLSNHSLPFHNDHCDILALSVMETAQHGGSSRWAPVGQIYNEIVRTKPQVIDVLTRCDWPHETPLGTVKYLPLMFIDDRRSPFLSFTRFALTGLPTYARRVETPKLTPQQADALDTIQLLASRLSVEVTQEKGDMFFINNRAILHAREKIEDPEGNSRRHLLRLCLRDTEYGRPIPEDLQRRWGDIFDLDDQNQDGKWVLDKEHDPAFVSNSKFDASFQNDETVGSHN